MAELGKLEVVIGAKLDELQKGLTEAQNALKGFSGNVQKETDSIGVNLASVGKYATMAGAAIVAASVAAGYALIKITSNMAEYGDQMGKMAQKTGISVETLSGLGYAAKMADIPIEGLQNGLKFLAKNSEEARDKSGAARDAFEKLGLAADVTGKQAKPLDQIFFNVADKFSQMEDGGQKTALAIKIFGRAGTEMIPILNQGSAGIKELMEEAKKLGVVLTEENVKALSDFNDAQKKLDSATQGLKMTIAEQLAPALTDIIEKTTAWYMANKELIDSKIKEWMQYAAIGFQTIAATMLDLLKYANDAKDGFKILWETLKIGVMATVESVAYLVSGFLELLSHIPKIGDSFKKASESVDKFRIGILDSEKESVDAIDKIVNENAKSDAAIEKLNKSLLENTASNTKKTIKQTHKFVEKETTSHADKLKKIDKEIAELRIKIADEQLKKFETDLDLELKDYDKFWNQVGLLSGEYTAIYQKYQNENYGINKETIKKILDDDEFSMGIKVQSLNEYVAFAKTIYDLDANMDQFMWIVKLQNAENFYNMSDEERKDEYEKVKRHYEKINEIVGAVQGLVSALDLAIKGDILGGLQKALEQMGPYGQLASAIIGLGRSVKAQWDDWFNYDKWAKWRKEVKLVDREMENLVWALQGIAEASGISSSTFVDFRKSMSDFEDVFTDMMEKDDLYSISLRKHTDVIQTAIKQLGVVANQGAKDFEDAQKAMQGLIDKAQELSDSVQESVKSITREFYSPTELAGAIGSDYKDLMDKFQKSANPEEQLNLLEEMKTATEDQFNATIRGTEDQGIKLQAQQDALNKLNWIQTQTDLIQKDSKEHLASIDAKFDEFLTEVENTNKWLSGLADNAKNIEDFDIVSLQALQRMEASMSRFVSKIPSYQTGTPIIRFPHIASVHSGEGILNTTGMRTLGGDGSAAVASLNQGKSISGSGQVHFHFPGTIFARDAGKLVDELMQSNYIAGSGRFINSINNQDSVRRLGRVNTLEN